MTRSEVTEKGSDMLMKIRLMCIEDYEKISGLWMHTPGMGLNDADDNRQGIKKYLTYRNQAIHELKRIDT